MKPNSFKSPHRPKSLFVFLLATLLFCTTATAQPGIFAQYRANYFVSATGNDSNNGKYPWSPWQTITKVNATTFQPGDIVAFKRGDAFTGTVTANASGTASNPITYGSYGTGAKPKIYGSEIMTGWTRRGNSNIYTKFYATDISQLYINGNVARLARYPETTHAAITGVTSQTVFTSTAITTRPANYYSGAVAIIRTGGWRMQQKAVTASTNQTLTIISAPTQETISTGDGFFLANKIEFLDHPGEWVYNATNDTLYCWMPNSDTPANYEVRASIHASGIDLNTRNYITVKNLDIQQQSRDCILLTTGSYNKIYNNILQKTTRSAVYSNVNIGSYNDISNNSIENIYHFGIYKSQTDTTGANKFRGVGWKLNSNQISNIGLYQNLGLYQSTLDFGIGIHAKRGSVQINDNTIQNIGFCGIIHGIGAAEIKRNYINGVLKTLDDGGAIYSFSMLADTIDGSVIADNIITGAIGNPTGSDVLYKQGAGIYFDGGEPGAKKMIVERNTIANATYGILSNNGERRNFKTNTFFDCTYAIYLNTTDLDTFLYNNTYATNRIDTVASFANGVYQKAIRPTNGNTPFLNYNIYRVPYTDTNQFDTSTWAAWQAAGKDLNSTFNSTDMTGGYTEKLIFNGTSVPKIFYLNAATNVTDAFTGTAVTASITLQPYTSKVLIGQNVATIAE